jgi:hypothetical protein
LSLKTWALVVGNLLRSLPSQSASQTVIVKRETTVIFV